MLSLPTRAIVVASRRAIGARALANARIRHLCAVPPPPPPKQEQSEIGSDPSVPAKPSALELLLAPDKKSETKKYLLGGFGALSAYGGVTLLTYNHWDFLKPLLPDAAGAAALIVGCGMTTAAFRGSGSGNGSAGKPGGKFQYEFELVPLGDAERYAATLGDIIQPVSSTDGASSSILGTSSGGGDKPAAPALHPELSKALEAAEQKASDAAKEANEAATQELVAELTAALADGSLPPRRLRQKLRPKVFVVDFDVRPAPREGAGAAAPARAPSNRELLDALREQVAFLLHVASPYDEVVLRVYSPGGSAIDYGYAAATFERLKAAGVATTACVDYVAASGGYMLACTADRILAAPLAVVGSIGVIAAMPNVSKLLDAQGVEVVQRTAGQHKRTVNIFTPNTPEGLQKFEEELELVHEAFISHVTSHRPQIDPRQSCTGETFFGTKAEGLGLVDEVRTSDAYLRARQTDAEVLLLRRKPPTRPSGLAALLSRVDATSASLAAAAAGIARAVAAPFGGRLAAEHLCGDEAGLLRAHMGGTASAGPRPSPAHLEPFATAAAAASASAAVRQAPLLRAGGAAAGPLAIDSEAASRLDGGER